MEWKLYVACYDALGQRSPAVWIQEWTKNLLIAEAPHDLVRAMNIYIMASDPNNLVVSSNIWEP